MYDGRLERKFLFKKLFNVTVFFNHRFMLVLRRFEESLHSVQIDCSATSCGFWLTRCISAPSKKEENFLLSEDNI